MFKRDWATSLNVNNYRSAFTTSALIFVGKPKYAGIIFSKYQELAWKISIVPLDLGLSNLKIDIIIRVNL